MKLKHGNVTFLSPNKKVTKEIGIGEVLRKGALPYVPHPPHCHPVFKNVPIFEHLPLKDLQFFCFADIRKSVHFRMSDGEAAQGFLKGGAPRSELLIPMIAGGDHTNIYAFSECPLKSPSFGTFLGEARKVQITVLCFTEQSSF